ncbi:hypothetical protein OSB04_022541 [Centaurea solstitialis]|uniref:YTH domain-containing family protein n=1 Tax=Centaurea solstitialis TaxID=347529 RepID=A0AA38TG75_9ASTR|nr:hypothetical protein OSB04_022541 [Centaurea solstitialis]
MAESDEIATVGVRGPSTPRVLGRPYSFMFLLTCSSLFMISGNNEAMSFDNSVVDSSVTEWKPDVENKNKQESPNDKVDKDAYVSGAEDQDRSCEQVGTSNANKRSKSSDTRYFIIKSLNHENIQLSIERGIWATQVMNEPILEEAYHNSGKVILIFSVNMSGFFQGYAQMMSSVGWRRDNVWSHGHGGSKPWGRSFKVKWLRLYDLPFQKTLHLKNPLNQYKPVKISRDCQELTQDIGEALCELLDGENGVDENQTSYVFNMDILPPKRPCVETFCGLQDEECDVDPMHMALASGPLIYPSMFYPHKSEANIFHLAQQRQAGAFHNPSNTPDSSFIKRSAASVDMGGDSSLLYDGWDLSAERSRHANALTDDDILEMTYEEYLEAHGRGSRISHQPVNEPFQRSRESSISKEHDE